MTYAFGLCCWRIFLKTFKVCRQLAGKSMFLKHIVSIKAFFEALCSASCEEKNTDRRSMSKNSLFKLIVDTP